VNSRKNRGYTIFHGIANNVFFTNLQFISLFFFFSLACALRLWRAHAHSYVKMDNFYTLTVYEKGAEVIRLYEAVLGKVCSIFRGVCGFHSASNSF
jgi:hypothetical protein